MRTLNIIVGIIGSIIIGLLLFMRFSAERDLQESKPYITYTRLINVASDCDKYKAQFGVWPSSLAQLRSFRPELNDWAKDAWGKGDDVWRGRYVILIPFDDSLGYGRIISYGRDGQPGGVGAHSDLEVRFPTQANTDWNKQQGAGLNSKRFRP